MILVTEQGRVPFVLSPPDKHAVESLLLKVAQDQPNQRDDFARRFVETQHPAWRRYVDGIYNYPKTWWVGIIQTQMVVGLWGAQRKAEASIRQAALARILYELTSDQNREHAGELIREAVRFNLKYRKADIAGRFHGGVFTNYVSMGGRHASVGTRRSLKWAGRITNFTIASFGAAIQAVVAKLKSEDDILNAIITGKADPVPAGYRNLAKALPDTATDELEHLVFGEVYGVDALNRVSPGPVPLREFCARPENVNLKNICE